MSDALRRTAIGTLPIIALLAALALLAAAAAPADERTIVNLFITIVLVLSIGMFSGSTGIVSFGHVAFMGIGAYVTALVTIPASIKMSALPELPALLANAQFGFLAAIVTAAVVTGLVAAVLGLALARMAPDAMAMATIGVLVIMFVVFESADEITRGASGLYAIPATTTVPLAAAAAIVVVVAARLLRESNIGIKLRATREDPVAAAALGANVIRLRFTAWIASAAAMGLGGGIWAQYNLAFGPRQFFFATTFSLLAMLVLGGLGSVSGAVLGALVITALTELLRPLEDGADIGPVTVGEIPGLTPIAVSALILLVLRWRRDGLLGHRELDELVAGRRSRSRATEAGDPTVRTTAPHLVEGGDR